MITSIVIIIAKPFSVLSVNVVQIMRCNMMNEIDEAIMEGNTPPKSKLGDIVPRVAKSLQVITETITCLLNGQSLNQSINCHVLMKPSTWMPTKRLPTT